MPAAVLLKLLVIFIIVALGWLAGRMQWLGPRGSDPAATPSRVLSNAAFYLFVPALLFRTTAQIDFRVLPWHTLAVFFIPAMGLLLSIYVYERWQRGAAAAANPAAPTVRAFTATFGNTVQVGIPFAAALFGSEGLAIHVTIVSMHAFLIVSVATALVELDLARAHVGGQPSLATTLLRTARSTLIHPVVLPVLSGLGWNALGLPIPALLDDTLRALGQAVVPVCLLLLGLSLHEHGLRASASSAIALSLLKLLVLPLAVFLLGRYGLGMSGLPLSVVVVCAALPTGSNALIFAQRYRVLEGEAAATSVLSTLGFVVTAALWLALLARFNP